MDKVDRLVLPIGCCRNVCSHCDEFFYEKRTSRSHRQRQTIRIVFSTVDVRSSGPSRFAIHYRVHSNLLQKSEKRQRARQCFYRGHSDAKVKT